MADYTERVSTMVRSDHPGAAPDGQLCLSDFGRKDGCRFNELRFPGHPPMLKRDKTLVNEAGECGYCHITEDDVREHILKKAHAIRLDVLNTLTARRGTKKDPKCH